MRFPESICDTNTFIKNICMFINIYKQVFTLQLVVLYIFIKLRERKKITEHYF